MRSKPIQFRQGDVLLTRVPALPDNFEKFRAEKNSERFTETPSDGEFVIVAHGETTGHRHRIKEEDAIMMEFVADPHDPFLDQTFVEVLNPTRLYHDEHKAIALEPGIYQLHLQREYNGSVFHPLVGD